MQLSQIWSHAYVDHFLIYIRPVVFSDWLKHQSSKTPLSKHLHLLLPCQFTGIFWVWIQSTVVRWDSWRKPLPGAQLCRLSITVSAALCPGGHPFLQFLSNIWEGSTGEGWAGFPPPIPPAPHKAHEKTTPAWLFLLRAESTNHEELHFQFVLKAPQSKGWCRNQRNQSNRETRTKGQVCSLPPDWCTPPAPGNQAPQPQAKQGRALQSRSEETWACGTWKGTTATKPSAGGWWKKESKALNLRPQFPTLIPLVIGWKCLVLEKKPHRSHSEVCDDAEFNSSTKDMLSFPAGDTQSPHSSQAAMAGHPGWKETLAVFISSRAHTVPKHKFTNHLLPSQPPK